MLNILFFASSPATGDQASSVPIFLFAGAVVVILIAVFFLRKK